MTVMQLKVELVKRGATTKGKKEDLIKRLVAFDQNNNFQSDPILTPDEIPMPSWPTCGFKSLTESGRHLLPKVTKEQIEMYVLYRQVLDKRMNKDIAAMIRGIKMEGQIEAISVVVKDSLCFVSSIVSAEMKQVSYSNKLIIDSNGGVQNTQCECAVGAGIHCSCKHVVAVLLGLSKFAAGGDIDITKSCTEELQSFQKPRRLHSRSPQKASGLKGTYIILNFVVLT